MAIRLGLQKFPGPSADPLSITKNRVPGFCGMIKVWFVARATFFIAHGDEARISSRASPTGRLSIRSKHMHTHFRSSHLSLARATPTRASRSGSEWMRRRAACRGGVIHQAKPRQKPYRGCARFQSAFMLPQDVRGAEFVGNMVPLRQDDVQIVPPHPSEPSCGGHCAGLGESGEPCETDAFTLRRPNVSGEGELDTTPPR